MQYHHRPGADGDVVVGGEPSGYSAAGWLEGVDGRSPGLTGTCVGNGEVQRLPPGIDQQQEVVVGEQYAVGGASGSSAPSRLAAESLDEFRVDADDPVAAFDLGLARANPLRRLLNGSKRRLGIVIAVHGAPPRSRTIAAGYVAALGSTC
jgi:hypothetical protein